MRNLIALIFVCSVSFMTDVGRGENSADPAESFGGVSVTPLSSEFVSGSEVGFIFTGVGVEACSYSIQMRNSGRVISSGTFPQTIALVEIISVTGENEDLIGSFSCSDLASEPRILNATGEARFVTNLSGARASVLATPDSFVAGNRAPVTFTFSGANVTECRYVIAPIGKPALRTASILANLSGAVYANVRITSGIDELWGILECSSASGKVTAAAVALPSIPPASNTVSVSPTTFVAGTRPTLTFNFRGTKVKSCSYSINYSTGAPRTGTLLPDAYYNLNRNVAITGGNQDAIASLNCLDLGNQPVFPAYAASTVIIPTPILSVIPSPANFVPGTNALVNFSFTASNVKRCSYNIKPLGGAILRSGSITVSSSGTANANISVTAGSADLTATLNCTDISPLERLYTATAKSLAGTIPQVPVCSCSTSPASECFEWYSSNCY